MPERQSRAKNSSVGGLRGTATPPRLPDRCIAYPEMLYVVESCCTLLKDVHERHAERLGVAPFTLSHRGRQRRKTRRLIRDHYKRLPCDGAPTPLSVEISPGYPFSPSVGGNDCRAAPSHLLLSVCLSPKWRLLAELAVAHSRHRAVSLPPAEAMENWCVIYPHLPRPLAPSDTETALCLRVAVTVCATQPEHEHGLR